MIDSNPSVIVIENKDRLTRFGFTYLNNLLKDRGCIIDVIHQDHEDETDLIKDMVAIITSFCCRLYGARRGQNKALKVKEILND
jgi:putative resolvase